MEGLSDSLSASVGRGTAG